MNSSQSGPDPQLYRPTSLDFINRPNPVEPHTVHPLNGKQRFERTPTKELVQISGKNVKHPVQDEGSRPPKRRRCGESSLDLPKLPSVRSETKRLRIPPTLSGLHQPPPDAKLLPSISTEQPSKVPLPAAPAKQLTRNESTGGVNAFDIPGAKHDALQADPKVDSTKKRKHRKWSDEETASLLKGVARFGIGNWTKILKCDYYQFERRTALDLKDRFRVCCPDIYLAGKTTKKSKAANANTNDQAASGQDKAGPSPWAKKSERMSTSEIRELGVDATFERSRRRQRTDYSAAEDDALLRGFRKLGNSWAAILAEEEILSRRTATDLRDRFRTRYPEEYAKIGLAPRPEPGSKKVSRMPGASDSTKRDAESNINDTNQGIVEPSVAHSSLNNSTTKLVETSHQLTASLAKPLATSLLSNSEDAFCGALLDEDLGESGHIILDRQILDWPFEMHKHKGNELDSLSTLNLPRPTVSNAAPQANIEPAASATAQSHTLATLPSLAAITAISDSTDFIDQLELPLLLGELGALEGDARTGAHLMNLEELLS